jgi:hypothetical protein
MKIKDGRNIARMGETRNTIKGKDHLGGRRRWKDNINTELIEIIYAGMHCIYLAQGTVQ